MARRNDQRRVRNRIGRLETLERRDLLAADGLLQIEPVEAVDDHHDHHDHVLVDYDIDSLPGNLVDESDPLLRVDSFGNQFYFDPAPNPDLIRDAFDMDLSSGAGDNDLQLRPPTVPIYHSNPDAAQKILLDFDGQIVSGTSWNQYNNNNPIHAPAYSTDGNLNSFNSTELARIEETFLRVAEDFAPFDVDVTTEDPGSAFFAQGGQGIRVIISTDRDANTGNQWFGGAGGVAFLNSWNFNSDTPVWVFYNNLGSAKNIAEASSHEAGHAFGLQHDGNNSTEYYAGHGSGITGWAPIMGVGYNRNLSQWSRGEYANANNTQNDLTIIRNDVGYRTDDHSSSTTDTFAATPISPAGNGSFSIDGVIEQRTDLDVFSITLNGGGNISVDADPVAIGPNIDIEISLYDQNGALVASDNPTNSIDASLTLNDLSGGIYLVAIDGVDKATPSTGYSDYGSLGQFTLSGSILSTDSNTAPDADDDEYTFDEDETYIETAPGVLTNDSDPNNDPLVIFTTPALDVSHGNLTLSADGSFTYVPDLNFNGTDSFQYLATDNNGGVGLGTVTLNVTPRNDAPVAAGDSYEVLQGSSLTSTLGVDDLLQNDSDVDGDSLNVNPVAVDGPSHGTLTLNVNGTFIYTPDPSYHGADQFEYEVTDGNGGMATAIVDIEVNPLGTDCSTPAPAGVLGDGFMDLFYNPVTGLMSIRVDSTDPDDGVNAVIISGPEPIDYTPPGAPVWGATAYFDGKMQLLIYNNDLFAGLEMDLPLLQYAPGLTASDFGCVESGQIGGGVGSTVYSEVAVSTDTLGPNAVATAANVTSPGGTSHTFDVTFNDDVAVQGSDIVTGTILVTGPNGYSELATVDSVTPAGNVGSLTATLTIPAAGGTWDNADLGTYTISIADYTITDTSNNFLVGGSVGTFDVNFTGTTPGDFDNDGDLDCDDVDELSAAIVAGSNDPIYDLNSSGTVTVEDLNFWVTEIKGTLLGDANLDFNVDGADFLIWNANKFEDGKVWCSGDFDGNGTVDGADFLIWNANKFQSPVSSRAAVGQADEESVDRSQFVTVEPNSQPAAAAANSVRYQTSSTSADASRRDDREEQQAENTVDFLFALGGF